MENSKSFLGRGWAFPVAFSAESNQVQMAEDEEDIQQSLIILLNTNLGELIMRTGYGANYRESAFWSFESDYCKYDCKQNQKSGSIS